MDSVVKVLRTKRGLDQDTFATKASVAPPLVSMIETGARELTPAPASLPLLALEEEDS